MRFLRKYAFWLFLFAMVTGLISAPSPQTARTRIADGFDFPVGKPDAERTMLVHAFVVLKDGAAPTEETARVLQDHVKKRIAPYKYPRKVSFVRDLPRTATGKLQRSALRKSQQEEGGQR